MLHFAIDCSRVFSLLHILSEALLCFASNFAVSSSATEMEGCISVSICMHLGMVQNQIHY